MLLNRLSEQLLHQRNQAREIERNFKRFSDLAPGGLAILDPSGAFTYANEQWFFIAGVTKEKRQMHLPLLNTGAIDDIDKEYYAAKWVELTTKLLPITMEIRMSTPWVGDIAGSVLTIQRWMLATFSPELDDDGNLKSVMGCSTDISRIKWAEDLQDRRLREADKTRRQQNSFIDITSHEMRNPLSAIVQCADGISTSLRQYKATKDNLDPELAVLIKEGVDAAETIQLCAQHQKSIVDDILTISRLDSNLLLITPVSTKPVEVVKLGLKMFTGECQMHSIALNLEIKPSFTKLRVDSVMLDSSRLTQILINLMTNAIKFTKNEKTRAINVSISAHRNPPSQIEGLPDFEWFPSPTKSTKDDITAGEEWGPGQVLYLRFEVRDTGCGLTPAEKSNLFTRFTQASPRTHVHYGGSGLGLFISRQLAELQGGEIGAASTFGKGSTFSFYIKCRRSLNRANSIDVESQLSSDLEGNARLATNVPKSIKDHEETTLSKLLDLHSEGLLNTNDPSSYGFEEEETTAPSPIRKPSYLLPTSWHVLIVEDNLVNQKVLAAQIKKLGCTAYVANHGKEAIDFLMKTDYWADDGSEGGGMVEGDSAPEAGLSPGAQQEANLKQSLSLVLLDIEMPIMDGLTCVRKIREMEASGQVRGHVPVIAVTANARSEQVTSAKQAGMDEVMSKPFRMVQLVPMIESLLIRTRRESPEGRGEVIPMMALE
ncbi:hypothetical protein CJF32_00000779 [Rutstroemia sp. NJR-2017a WRK4]|nr:hypothetical protein CJF32_00000779 [Rutstroemia sp. NJR-2017a WRK4]